MAELEPLTHEELVQLHIARGMTRAEAEDMLAAEQTHAASVTPEEISAKRAELERLGLLP